MKKLPKIIAIIGATATGKTALAVKLAREFNGEIISADSRQVYRGMDIGTGKDLAEYGDIPYHMIDVADPDEQFDLKAYQESAYKAINGVLRRKKLPIVVGGSGLYIQALIDGYELSEAGKKPKNTNISLTIEQIKQKLGKNFVSKLNQSEQNNKRRLLRYLEIREQSDMAHENLHGASKPRYDALVIGLQASIETIRKNIKKRLESRFKQGMIEEVSRLHGEGLSWDKLESFGLEYRFIAQYLQDEDSCFRRNDKLDSMKERLYIASGQFAKRQLTWFRRWEKQGREIRWVRGKEITKIKKLIEDFIK